MLLNRKKPSKCIEQHKLYANNNGKHRAQNPIEMQINNTPWTAREKTAAENKLPENIKYKNRHEYGERHEKRPRASNLISEAECVIYLWSPKVTWFIS